MNVVFIFTTLQFNRGSFSTIMYIHMRTEFCTQKGRHHEVVCCLYMHISLDRLIAVVPELNFTYGFGYSNGDELIVLLWVC